MNRFRMRGGVRSVGVAAFASTACVLVACSTSVPVYGPSSDVYPRVRDAVLKAGFAIEDSATGTVGEQPAAGRFDVRVIEQTEKFEANRFVSVRIVPFGDESDVARTVDVNGWKYTWLSVVTFRAYKSGQSDIEQRAAEAVRDAFPPRRR